MYERAVTTMRILVEELKQWVYITINTMYRLELISKSQQDITGVHYFQRIQSRKQEQTLRKKFGEFRIGRVHWCTLFRHDTVQKQE